MNRTDTYTVEVDHHCYPLERSWIECGPRIFDPDTLDWLRKELAWYLYLSCGRGCRLMRREAYLLKHGLVQYHLQELRSIHGLSLYDPRRAYNTRKVVAPLCHHCAQNGIDVLNLIQVIRMRKETGRKVSCHANVARDS